MKKTSNLLSILILMIVLSACGINNAIIQNHNQNATLIQLSSNNFKIVDRVTGSAEVTYIFLIGGMKKTQLYENAYAAMVNKANLGGSSKAIVNTVTEEHLAGVPPFYVKRTVTMTSHVVEFVK